MSPSHIFSFRPLSFSLLLLFAAALPLSASNKPENPESISSTIDRIAPGLIEENHVPGISIALIENHEISWLGQYGVASAADQNRVTRETTFEAASMSKPLFGFIVLQLVEEGKIDLDTPLSSYLDAPYLEDEPLHETITARIVLSHRTGFPNWRKGGWRKNGPLAPNFIPGTGYGYSGEGFLFLQRTIEQITGEDVETLARRYLLDRIDMNSSSYIWQKGYEKTAAAGHTKSGKIPQRKRSIYHTPNTAFTLYTTAEDYAKFLITMMRPADKDPVLLNKDLRSLMLTPATLAEGRTPVDRGGDEEKGQVYFGLGWRIETTPTGTRYCHSGSNGNGFKCFSEFNPENGNGIVILTNSKGGVPVWEGIMAAIGTELHQTSHLSSETAGN